MREEEERVEEKRTVGKREEATSLFPSWRTVITKE